MRAHTITITPLIISTSQRQVRSRCHRYRVSPARCQSTSTMLTHMLPQRAPRSRFMSSGLAPVAATCTTPTGVAALTLLAVARPARAAHAVVGHRSTFLAARPGATTARTCGWPVNGHVCSPHVTAAAGTAAVWPNGHHVAPVVAVNGDGTVTVHDSWGDHPVRMARLTFVRPSGGRYATAY